MRTAEVNKNTHQDFNGSSGDLGGDTQSLEERGLLRTQTSVLGWHSYVTGGNGTSTSSSWHLNNKRKKKTGVIMGLIPCPVHAPNV